jgi:hypothetical protein
VAELRRIDPVAGAPRGGRRPLRELDAVTRAAIGSARDVIDSDALEVDDGTWDRARGIALHQAALIILYYRDTNPGLSRRPRGPSRRSSPTSTRDDPAPGPGQASGDPGRASRRPDWVWRTKAALVQASGMVVAST